MPKLEPVKEASAATIVSQTSNEELLLLEQIATGDKQAFAKLYHLMSGRVFGLVLRLLQDRAQAEEVMQEIFVEIWRLSSQYDASKGRPYTWIMTISHRRAIDRIRASESSHRRDIKVGVQEFVETYDDVATNVETHMEAGRVNEAMKHLTVIQRETIQFVYYGGLSQKEVAERLHVPVNTVKTRLRDGMIRLRDELGVVT